MVYTQEEKMRMVQLLCIFADYVADSKEIDIAYSEKTGYVRLIIDEGADTVFFRIGNFDDMLIMFMSDIFMDFAESKMCSKNRVNSILKAYQYLQNVLNTLEDNREYAQAKLDQFYEHIKSVYNINDL